MHCEGGLGRRVCILGGGSGNSSSSVIVTAIVAPRRQVCEEGVLLFWPPPLSPSAPPARLQGCRRVGFTPPPPPPPPPYAPLIDPPSETREREREGACGRLTGGVGAGRGRRRREEVVQWHSGTMRLTCQSSIGPPVSEEGVLAACLCATAR